MIKLDFIDARVSIKKIHAGCVLFVPKNDLERSTDSIIPVHVTGFYVEAHTDRLFITVNMNGVVNVFLPGQMYYGSAATE